MKNFSKNDIVLIKYPFSNLTNFKVRPAIVINAEHPSIDLFIVPLTSNTTNLLPGEFVLNNWLSEGLNVASAVKRGIYTVEENLVLQHIGRLSETDEKLLNKSIKFWLEIE